MSKYGKKLKEAEFRKEAKKKSKERAEEKKQSVSQAGIDNNSTRDTFLEWLYECGRDLGTFEYSKSDVVLSFAGSDGPTIKENNIDGVPYNKPEALNKWLEDQGAYKPFDSVCIVYLNPPTMRYIDWFNNKYKK